MKIVKRIISWIYTLVVVIRHRLYDWGVFKSYSFDIPIVCIGNITVGGTGKTPTAEYILNSLQGHYTMAILSRGYGRDTKGYREVTIHDVYSDVGDEPLRRCMLAHGAHDLLAFLSGQEERFGGAAGNVEAFCALPDKVTDQPSQFRRIDAPCAVKRGQQSRKNAAVAVRIHKNQPPGYGCCLLL
jgi:hypothetical protein